MPQPDPRPDPRPDPPRNLADLVRRAADRDAEHTALLVGVDGRLSWGALDEQVDRAAAGFVRLGLAPGDRVALCLGNTPVFAVAYFGALRAGLVAVPLNTESAAEAAHLLADSGAAALVTDGEPPASRADLPELRHILVAADQTDQTDQNDLADSGAQNAPDGFAALLAAAPADPVNAPTGGEDLAVLVYTSGTSGRPKGVMLSHRALLANLDQCARLSQPPPVVPADVVLLAAPLFHAYGLNPGLGMVAWAGATGLLVPRFDAAGSLRLMARHRVTHVPGTPQMYAAWAETNTVAAEDVAAGFASVRLPLSGAAPLPAAVAAAMAECGVVVHEGYGLTEAAPVVTSTLTDGPPKPGSVGRPLPGVELELRDSQGDRVEEGDPGDVAVRGPNLFSGYWPDGHDGPDGAGWFVTGDVAYADADGDLHLVDQRAELVVVNGFSVYPAEIEAVLVAHPEIAEAAVVGVPDDDTGEAVCAYVVAEPGATPRPRDVIAYCGRSLARFKCPTEVRIVPRLPRTATGNVRRAVLREEARARAAGSGRP